jgi:glycosyltransferase involved in cell wall biosynthesis
MISVFTPTNNTKYLGELYESLVAQTFTDWEWIVYLNGDADEMPVKALDDSRVKTFRWTGETGNIGLLKRMACVECDGSILVEVDHDDYLMPTALQKIYDAFYDHPDVSLVYSDCKLIDSEGSTITCSFDPVYGWQFREDGSTAISFEPHPHNICHIWYAPNHLRAIRTEAYKAVGGYAPLPILDDQDLMSRLYKEGRFLHIFECLYAQRIHDGNTQKMPEVNARIQSGTIEMYHRDIESLMTVWAQRRNVRAMRLPSGTSLDVMTENSFGLLVIEDLLQRMDPLETMEKLYDVLCDGGMAMITVPSTDGRGAFQDPKHVSFWNENSFWYYTDRKYADMIGFDGRFQVSNLTTYFPSEWHKAHDISYVRANLIAIKSDTHRYGGILNI